MGAGIVSTVYEHPLILALLLGGCIVAYLLRGGVPHLRDALLEVSLLITIAIIGYLTESWGTTNAYWTYAHVSPGHHVPVWVPVAWAAAGALLHRLDEASRDAGRSLGAQLTLAYVYGAVLPLLGESICIAMGVWSYVWPWKILGVPVLALLLIAYAHLVFLLMREGLAVLANQETPNRFTSQISVRLNRPTANARTSGR